MTKSPVKVIAISNPYSGNNKRGGFAKFSATIESYSAIQHLTASQSQEIATALMQCKQQEIPIIIVNGGDGTLQLILTYLRSIETDYDPYLVLLKAGTTSMSYGDVGCKGKLNTLFQDVLRFANNESCDLQQTERSVLQLELPKTKQQVCGMFFGAGAIYSGILYCRQNLHSKGMRGELGPSLAMLRFLLDWITVGKLAVPARAELNINTKHHVAGSFNIIAATSLRRLLMGVYPFWVKTEDNKQFSFTCIEVNTPQPARAFFNILRGRAPKLSVKTNAYQSYSAGIVRMSIQGGFTLDGELFGDENSANEVILRSAKPVKFLVR